jgi:hypothetical protein
MVTSYFLMLSFKVAQIAGNQPPGALLLGVCLHLTSKYFGSTFIRAIQFDI